MIEILTLVLVLVGAVIALRASRPWYLCGVKLEAGGMFFHHADGTATYYPGGHRFGNTPNGIVYLGQRDILVKP